MSNPLREHLVGYLLNAVEADEHKVIEKQLARDGGLRQDVQLLQRSLEPLAVDQGHHDAPVGLAQRCCQYVYSRTEIMPVALSPAGTIGGTVNRRRWSWLDLSVAGAIAVAVAVLLVPAIYQSSAHARLLACQNNLKDIGYATASYSDRNGGYYPIAEPGDPAGSWAPQLVGDGYLTNADRSLICPSSKLADDRQFRVLKPAELKELKNRLSPAEFAAVLDKLSGSYGETLGYTTDDGKTYQRQRMQHRHGFVIASDLPGEHAANSPNHGGRGQNVVFEDGSVAHLPSAVTAGGDNIFLNDMGQVAPAQTKTMP